MGGKVYVAWKRKILHDVIGGHQAYIHRKIYLWGMEFCSCLRPRAVSKTARHEIIYIYSRFFENQPNEICSHLSEKASKGRFLKPEKLQNHSKEGKGKEKKKSEEKERRGRKKKQWLHS